MKFIVNFVLMIIASYTSYKVIRFLNDKGEDININNKSILKLSIIYYVYTHILINLYGFSWLFIFYYLTSIYLVVTAYIDFRTKHVYCLLNIVMGIISIIYLIYLIINGIDISKPLIGIVLTLLISILFSKLDIWAWGDSEILIAISPIISLNINPIFNIMLAIALSGIISIVQLFKTKFKLDSRQAFAPYIMLSSLITLVI
jgi:prepilin signal peptidase PulO-like enzyme (type II secretory pathway)